MDTNRIIQGDICVVASGLPKASVNCIVTSPPYWGLRDYLHSDQLGLEATPEEYVEKMVGVFRGLYDVLRDDGTLWLNLGDSYAQSSQGRSRHNATGSMKRPRHDSNYCEGRPIGTNLKPKDLVGIPWRVALALQADGWYLRQDIIWHKPNPMPESVTDRCTKAHEYIFLLTKKPRYYYDAEAIKEQATCDRMRGPAIHPCPDTNGNEGLSRRSIGLTRNKRSVWTVATAPYKEAHFATFPPKLIEPCILAGCPREVCVECGKPRERIVDRKKVFRERPNDKTNRHEQGGGVNSCGNTVAGVETTTTGWTDCGCGKGFRPGVVLDPFFGSGTVGQVCVQNGRDWLGVEINLEYIELAKRRISGTQRGLAF